MKMKQDLLSFQAAGHHIIVFLLLYGPFMAQQLGQEIALYCSIVNLYIVFPVDP